MASSVKDNLPRRKEVSKPPESAYLRHNRLRPKPRKPRRVSLLGTRLLVGILAAGGADAYIFLRFIAPSQSSAVLSPPALASASSSRDPLTAASRPTCRISPQKARMMTPAELANPTLSGTLVNDEGVIG